MNVLMRAFAVALLTQLLCPRWNVGSAAITPHPVFASVQVAAANKRSGDASSSDFSQVLDNYRASHLIGSTVKNQDGQFLGRLKGLVLDLSMGQTVFGLVASGGLLGLGQRCRAVPASAISMATTEGDVLAVEMSLQRWATAPVFKNLAQLARNRTAIERFYSKPQPATEQPLSATGRTAATPTKDQRHPNLVRANQIIGLGVVALGDQPVGKISDLIVEFSGTRPAFALVQAGTATPPATYAVPLGLLRARAGVGFKLNASAAALPEAPFLDAQAWEHPEPQTASTIYRLSNVAGQTE
jgi:uncharacterized protein YrrD